MNDFHHNSLNADTTHYNITNYNETYCTEKSADFRFIIHTVNESYIYNTENYCV